VRIDYNGEVIPWYERPLAGGFNYTWEQKPPDPPAPEVQQYIANENYIQQKMQEGNSGIGGFLTSYINPVLDSAASDPIKTAAMLVASVVAPELIPLIAGADTAIAGGTPEDILKSAATAYATQAIGGEIKGALGGLGGVDPLTADDMYTGQAMTNLASSDDATRLAQMLKEFGNPTELTGPTSLVTENPSVSIGNATVDESLGLPNIPSNLQNEAYLDPGLIDVAPENVTIGTPEPNFNGVDLGGANVGQIGGGIIGSNIGNGTSIQPNLNAGELTVTGTPEPLPYTPFEENFPTQTETPTSPTNPIKLNTGIKTTTSTLPKAIATQQQTNLANVLRGAQLPQTLLPPIYHQANPFNFGQQATPVQDTTALAKLLRTA
jgi:hypothetical protein